MASSSFGRLQAVIEAATLTHLIVEPRSARVSLRLWAPAEGDEPGSPHREWQVWLLDVSRVSAWLRDVRHEPGPGQDPFHPGGQVTRDVHPPYVVADMAELNEWLHGWSGHDLAGQPEEMFDAPPPEWLRWASLDLVRPDEPAEAHSIDLWLGEADTVGARMMDLRVEFGTVEIARAGPAPATAAAPAAAGRRGPASGPRPAPAGHPAPSAGSRSRTGGSSGRRRQRPGPSLRARRARAVAVLGVLALSGAAWAAVGQQARPGRRQRAAPAARPAAHTPRGLPAAEAGLLPWHLAAPVSREVVVAPSRGRLIILGGLTAGGVSANGVYSIRTSSGRGGQIGSLSAPLHDAAGAVLGGKALVFGGGSSATVPTVEAFRLGGSGGSQPTAATAGAMPVPRSDSAAATIGATTYVVGGYDGAKPDAPVLATGNGRTFRTVASLPVPVRYPAVAALGGQIFVFGGQAVTGPHAGAPVATIQAVDPARGTASVVGHLPEPLAGAAAMTVNGELFLAGGESSVAQHRTPGVGTTQLPPGELAPGGAEASSSSPTYTVSTIWAFDPATRRMLPAGQLQVPVSHAAVAVSGSTAWIVGGESHGSLVAAVQMVRPDRAFGTAGAPGAGSPYFGAKLLIADRGNNRILLFNDQMHLLWKYPSAKAPRDPLRFYFPDDAFFIDHGTAILSNQEQNETIIKIAFPSGKIFWSYGHPGHRGTAPGYLYEPDDAYLLKNGQITVADANNCRVLVINPNGTVAHQIGTNGVCVHHPPTELGNPNGDTPLPDGNLLISEINGSWVSEYTMTGKLVWTTTLPIGYPSDPQQLGPDLYLIADYSSRGGILEFNRKGRVLYHYHPASGPGRLDHPSLTELLPSGVFMVNDDYNNRMVAIDPATGSIVWQYGVTGRHGRRPGMLHTPDGFDLLLPNGTTPTHRTTG